METYPTSNVPPDAFDARSPAITPGVPRLPVLKALTAVRFFAAAHVAFYHFIRPFARWGIFAAAMAAGYEGVSFFFVLSGFILTYSHATEYERKRGSVSKFYIARIARIYPVYALALIVAAIQSSDQFHNKIHILAFVADFLVMQAWNMRMVNFFHSGAWTLSCEAFFYLIFPYLLLRLRPRTRGAAFAWIGFFYALSIATPLLVLHFAPDAGMHEFYSSGRGAGLVFLVSRLPLFATPEFLAGVSLGWLFLRFKPTQRTSAFLAFAGTGLLLLALAFSDHLPYLALHNGILLPAYAMLLLGLSQPNLLTRLLSGRVIVLLGEASFALYLFHPIVLNQTHHGDDVLSWSAAAWAMPTAIALSVAVHLLVERPCRRAILTWWAQRHPRTLVMT